MTVCTASTTTTRVPPYYFLTMLPYTSGDLHIGHWYAMAPSDVAARWHRMQGKNVLFPLGFDAFGLPAENAAINNNTHPKQWTYENVENMTLQLKTMGASFDWNREFSTADPEYYRWTQWWFLQLYKHGLAYRASADCNYCPQCGTVLANEQVLRNDEGIGICERCDAIVEAKQMEQWMFRITDYADELLEFDGLDWPEPIKLMQRNWIGRSEGAEISFPLGSQINGEDRITVFTTRPDTLFGCTFMVLAPEHPLVAELTSDEQRAEVEAYIEQARRQNEIERQSTSREKTGVFTGAYAKHPFSGDGIQIWIADYVLLSYGTGAVMGVPAHDERDFAFASARGIPIPVVIAPPDWDGNDLEEAYTGPGKMVNSGTVRRHRLGSGQAVGRRRAGRSRSRWPDGLVSAARLADFAPALLGRADSDGLLRILRRRPRTRVRSSGAAARRRRVSAHRRVAAGAARGLRQHRLS